MHSVSMTSSVQIESLMVPNCTKIDFTLLPDSRMGLYSVQNYEKIYLLTILFIVPS